MMERKYHVTALGELLIDFIQNGFSIEDNPLFEANPGGAPANVLSYLAKADKKTAFIGKVGNDSFGRLLKDCLADLNIDTDFLYSDDKIPTTLALVSKNEEGDRDFSFYRSPGADIMLKEDEIKKEMFDTEIFHLGTLSMSDEPSRSATIKALDMAKENGCLISFDPNLRPPLWNSLDDAKWATDYVLKRTDILKISDNEIEWFTGLKDYDEAIEYLKDKYPKIRFISLTLGKDGSRIYYDDIVSVHKAYLSDKTIDTTGAGDAYCASILNLLLEYGLDNINREKIEFMQKVASMSSSLLTQRKGALKVMPVYNDVLEILKNEIRDN